MAITVQAGGRWFGLIADTKPTLDTLQEGHEFYETDGLFVKSIWTGTEWKEQGSVFPNFQDDFTTLTKGWVNNSALPAIGINTGAGELQYDTDLRTGSSVDTIAVDLRNINGIGANGLSDIFNLRCSFEYTFVLGIETSQTGIALALCDGDQTEGWNDQQSLVGFKLRTVDINCRQFLLQNDLAATKNFQSGGTQINTSGNLITTDTLFIELRSDGTDIFLTTYSDPDFTNVLFSETKVPVVNSSGLMHYLKVANGANNVNADGDISGGFGDVVIFDGLEFPPT